MKKDEILYLAFQLDITWGYEILNKFLNEMSDFYKKRLAKELIDEQELPALLAQG